jgi:hypothetical protein
MEITSVTVSVHEKRNHPHEFGHYDCDVRFTADLEDGEDADLVARQLRHRAGVQVAAECDAWVEGIEETILSQQEEYARRQEEARQRREAEREKWESLQDEEDEEYIAERETLEGLSEWELMDDDEEDEADYWENETEEDDQPWS